MQSLQIYFLSKIFFPDDITPGAMDPSGMVRFFLLLPYYRGPPVDILTPLASNTFICDSIFIFIYIRRLTGPLYGLYTYESLLWESLTNRARIRGPHSYRLI